MAKRVWRWVQWTFQSLYALLSISLQPKRAFLSPTNGQWRSTQCSFVWKLIFTLSNGSVCSSHKCTHRARVWESSNFVNYFIQLAPPPTPTLSCCTIDSHRSSFMPNQYSPATGELIRFHIQPLRPHSRSHLSRSLALVIILISLMYRNRRVVICRCCVSRLSVWKFSEMFVHSGFIDFFIHSFGLSHIAFAV